MEFPVITKKWGKSIHKLDIVYPNLYYGGVYSLAMLIFYNYVNSLNNWQCNRVYLDKGKLSAKLIGFTLNYELDYMNVIKILKLNKLPLTKDRDEILFAGGNCVTSNPEIYSELFDFLFLGEVEESLAKILDIYEKFKDKPTFLEKIKDIPGVYVPGKTKHKTYGIVKDLDKIIYPLYQPLPKILSKEFVFGSSFILETERGCPYKCKFCMLGSLSKSVRQRSLKKIKGIIDKGTKLNKRDKVIIYAPSFVHKDRKEILRYMLSKGLTFSVPSIKAETVDEEFISLVVQGGQKTLTLAPECNESLRFKIKKLVKDETFFKVVDYANKYKVKKLKYYFLLGLPGQTMNDLKETVELIKSLKTKFKGQTYVSFNPLVGKPMTEFSGIVFDKKKIKTQALYLKKELSKIGVKIKIPSVSSSEKEYKLANLKGSILRLR
ncbi:radical SAM protein [Candidatus Woesearchaeota archaeon]|nr:MAG: radical SAM protein [Candidatus Woesearchaeota archaeon]